MKVDQLANMLISVGLVHADSVFDPDGYDGGQTYDNICALYDKLFPVADNAAAQRESGGADGCSRCCGAGWYARKNAGGMVQERCDCPAGKASYEQDLARYTASPSTDSFGRGDGCYNFPSPGDAVPQNRSVVAGTGGGSVYAAAVGRSSDERMVDQNSEES